MNNKFTSASRRFMSAYGKLRRKALINEVGEKIKDALVEDLNKNLQVVDYRLKEVERKLKLATDTLGSTMVKLEVLREKISSNHTINMEEINKLTVDKIRKVIEEAQKSLAKETPEPQDKVTEE